MLREEGWEVGKKLVARIRRECGLKVRCRPPRRRRRGRSTGSPTQAERPNHVWSWDFIADRTDNGGKLRVLSVIDEYTRECLALHVARAIGSKEVIGVLDGLVAERGAPGHIRSDKGLTRTKPNPTMTPNLSLALAKLGNQIKITSGGRIARGI
jgi:putative transposase